MYTVCLPPPPPPATGTLMDIPSVNMWHGLYIITISPSISIFNFKVATFGFICTVRLNGCAMVGIEYRKIYSDMK